MKLAVAFVCLLALASAAPSLPQFGQNFVETEKDDMVMHQGQYLSGSNQLCCAPGDNCEIQTESQQGTNYVRLPRSPPHFFFFGCATLFFSSFPEAMRALPGFLCSFLVGFGRVL